jgi:hypothetical protein
LEDSLATISELEDNESLEIQVCHTVGSRDSAMHTNGGVGVPSLQKQTKENPVKKKSGKKKGTVYHLDLVQVDIDNK